MQSERAAFLAFHDQYLAVMDRAYATGETQALLPMLGPEYHGYFGTGSEERASPYDLADALDGIKQTAGAFPGARQRTENRTLLMEDDEHAVLFYEKSMDLGPRVARAFVMEVWHQIDGQWRLLRDTVENA